MGDGDIDLVTINQFNGLSEDMSSLFLNKNFSDITLIVDGKIIHSHKNILAMRSKYFEAVLIKDKDLHEMKIPDVSIETFSHLLKYMYTGSISLSTSKHLLDLLGLAFEFSVKNLELAIIKLAKSFINLKNIHSFLNLANSCDLVDLQDLCCSFMDKHASEILADDSFTHLTRESIIKLLKRDSFFAPEIDIFKGVANWCSANKHDLDVIQCVRFSWLSVEDILTTVYLSQLVDDNDQLLKSMIEVVDIKPKLDNCRAKLEMDENIATSFKGARVITGSNTDYLLNYNKDITRHAHHTIVSQNGIIIALGSPSIINNIRLRLWDGDDARYYNYYIEVSIDQDKWKKIIDHTQFFCRSEQDLYFEKEIAKYVRVIGTNSSTKNGFHLVSFEAYYKSSFPKVISGVVCPNYNVATTDKKAIVIEGSAPENLLNGNYESATSHTIGEEPITIQLAQPYNISSVKFLIWDKLPVEKVSYYVETSVNKSDWVMVADKRSTKCESWQILQFPERAVVFIRITGTWVEEGDEFTLLHFECPAVKNEI